MENYRSKNLINRTLEFLFYLLFILSSIISLRIPLINSVIIVIPCLLIISFVLYFSLKEKKTYLYPLSIFVVYVFISFSILNLYQFNPEIIKKEEKKQARQIANFIISELKGIWNSYINLNNSLLKVAIKNKALSNNDLYNLLKIEIDNSKLQNYSFAIFNKYYIPLLWVNKPKSLLIPSSTLQEFSEKPNMIFYGKSSILISKRKLSEEKFIIFELSLEEKSIVSNKYLGNNYLMQFPENVSLVFKKASKNYKNTFFQETAKISNQSFIKYNYNFNIPSTDIAVSIIIKGNSYASIVKKKIFFFSLLNFFILGILVIYYSLYLTKKISFDAKKLWFYLIISIIVWSFRASLFLIDQKELQKAFNLFDPTNFALKETFGLFKSAGDFFFTSFIIMIQVFLLFGFIKSLVNKIKCCEKIKNYFIFPSFLLFFSVSYYYFSPFLKKIIFNSSKDLTLYLLPSFDNVRLFLLYSIHFLETSLAFIFYLLLLKTLEKFKKEFRFNKFILFFFIVLLINFSSYIIRFNYHQQQKQKFLKTNIASMIKEQDSATYELFTESLKEVSRILNSDYKERDLFTQNTAFKIWTKTSFPIYGINSGIDFYDLNLNLIDKFSYKAFSFSVPELLKEFSLNDFNDNWKIIKKMIFSAQQEKNILWGIKKIFGKYLCLVYVEITYENLPFAQSKNPYDELFLSPLHSFPEEEQYFPELIVSIYRINKLLYTNSIRALPFLPYLIERDWQKINFNNEKYYAYYFSDGQHLFAIAYPITNFSTFIARLIEISIFDSFLLGICFLCFYLFSFLIKKEKYFLLNISDTFAKKIFIYLILIAFLPICILFLSTRNYIIKDKIEHSRLEALNQLQSSLSLISDFIYFNKEQYQTGSLLNDEIIEWISETTGYDINIYRDFIIEATSRRELFTSGLLPPVVKGQTYYQLYYERKPYIIEKEEIGKLSYFYIASSLELPNQPFRIVILPLLFSKEKIDIELAKFYEKILLSFALIIGLSSLLISIIANRISGPVKSVIAATQMIADGHFEIKIPQFKDYEFNVIKNSLEAMAKKLNQSLLLIKQRQAYIEAIIANVTDGVIAISLDGKVNLINEAAKNFLDCKSLAINNIFELNDKSNTINAFVNLLKKFNTNLSDIQSQQYEVFKEGKIYHYKVSWIPLPKLFSNQDIIIVIEDLTDVIISNRLSAWADMAKRVAHEIKNPLTPMQLAIDHLYKVFKESPKDYENVLEICYTTISKQINNLKKIVKQFSLFSAEKPSKKQYLSLPSFIHSIVEPYKIHLKNKIDFVIEIDQNIPKVHWDIEKMQKVFNNLIENSIQAIENKGIISIKAYQIEKLLRIELSDNGIGMDENTARKLFEPYFTTKDFGTGLGLVIAKKFIEEHNGKISISSKLGEGTIINIDFEL